jgi:hypothetical protein
MANTLNLEWQAQVVTPTLIQGADAQRLYNLLPEKARNGMRYDENSKLLIGSNSFSAAILDTEAQKYGARVPNLRDLSRPEVTRIVKNRHYTDSRNLIVRSPTDPDYSRNDALLKTIYGLAEEKLGKINSPFMIEGYNFVPNPEDKTGYGLSIVERPDFKVIQDERFDGKYGGQSFSEVDEQGIPNFDKKGNRTWYAKSKGLSGLCLSRSLNLYSGYDNLAFSYDDGRVVFLK